MKMVVTGREGQVVQSLLEKAAQHPDLEVIALGRPELDLADPATIRKAIVNAKPDVVVSAAAYTAVDQAEDEPEIALAARSTTSLPLQLRQFAGTTQLCYFGTFTSRIVSASLIMSGQLPQLGLHF